MWREKAMGIYWTPAVYEAPRQVLGMGQRPLKKATPLPRIGETLMHHSCDTGVIIMKTSIWDLAQAKLYLHCLTGSSQHQIRPGGLTDMQGVAQGGAATCPASLSKKVAGLGSIPVSASRLLPQSSPRAAGPCLCSLHSQTSRIRLWLFTHAVPALELCSRPSHAPALSFVASEGHCYLTECLCSYFPNCCLLDPFLVSVTKL